MNPATAGKRHLAWLALAAAAGAGAPGPVAMAQEASTPTTAGSLPPDARLVEPGIGDVSPLRESLRQPRVDLRLPAGFRTIYRFDQDGRPTLARADGALVATFDQSEYYVVYDRQARQDRVVTPVPAGTVYWIGLPGEPSATAGSAEPSVPAGAGPAGGTISGVPTRVETRVDRSAAGGAGTGDGSALAAPSGEARAMHLGDGAPVRIDFLLDAPYRHARLDRILERAVADPAMGGSPRASAR